MTAKSVCNFGKPLTQHHRDQRGRSDKASRKQHGNQNARHIRPFLFSRPGIVANPVDR